MPTALMKQVQSNGDTAMLIKQWGQVATSTTHKTAVTDVAVSEHLEADIIRQPC